MLINRFVSVIIIPTNIFRDMGKSSIANFFRKHDRYGRNVTLFYKKDQSFKTPIGGCCTIFCFVILTYWLIVNVLAIFLPPGSYTTST